MLPPARFSSMPSFQSQLCKASGVGDLAEMARLIDGGAEPNALVAAHAPGGDIVEEVEHALPWPDKDKLWCPKTDPPSFITTPSDAAVIGWVWWECD